MFELIHYQTQDGKDRIAEWFDSLRDARAAALISARLTRLKLGLFGDCKPIEQGVWELRIDHGPGYRVYYARGGAQLIVLLAGGDKDHQKQDIQTALHRWQDWQRNSNDNA